MIYVSVILPLLLALLLAQYMIPRILMVSVKKDLVIPSETKDKGRLRVPRLGGVSLFPVLVISAGATAALCARFDGSLLWMTENDSDFVQYMFAAAGLTTMYLLGVMDDLLGVSITSKLIIECLAALLIPLSGLWLDNLHGVLGIYELPWWIGMPLTMLTVLYISNAIPMLDDVDGLASGLAMIAFTVLGVVAFLADELVLLIFCSAMTGMLGPFFFRNVIGSRMGLRNIYLGDTGSLTIGYILSVVVIGLSRLGGRCLPEGAIMVCFGTLLIPMFDVFRVAVTRMVNHRNMFRRDNNHIHHRLMQGGMGPVQVLVFIMIITFSFVILNVVCVWFDWNLSVLLVTDVSLWLILQVVISYYKNKKRNF